MERDTVLYSVPLTAPLVVETISVVKLVLENSIFLYLMSLYPPWEELQMATTEEETHGSLVSTVNPLVPLLEGFDVIFLKIVDQLLICT